MDPTQGRSTKSSTRTSTLSRNSNNAPSLALVPVTGGKSAVEIPTGTSGMVENFLHYIQGEKCSSADWMKNRESARDLQREHLEEEDLFIKRLTGQQKTGECQPSKIPKSATRRKSKPPMATTTVEVDGQGLITETTPITIIQQIEPMLPMSNYQYIDKNVMGKDEKVLTHLPYVDDDDDIAFHNKLMDAYEDNEEDYGMGDLKDADFMKIMYAAIQKEKGTGFDTRFHFKALMEGSDNAPQPGTSRSSGMLPITYPQSSQQVRWESVKDRGGAWYAVSHPEIPEEPQPGPSWAMVPIETGHKRKLTLHSICQIVANGMKPLFGRSTVSKVKKRYLHLCNKWDVIPMSDEVPHSPLEKPPALTPWLCRHCFVYGCTLHPAGERRVEPDPIPNPGTRRSQRLTGGCSCGRKVACSPGSQCKCRLEGRECNPDYCKCCGIAELNVEDVRCKNSDLQLGKAKKVELRPSTIPGAGWGAFMMEAVKIGEFIMESCGEIITEEEASRRDITYQKRHSSYLFEFTPGYVLDGTRSGNFARFINHADVKSKVNCYAKQVKVNGDQRVGIYARKRLKPDTELLLDYGYKLRKWLKGNPKTDASAEEAESNESNASDGGGRRLRKRKRN